MHVLDLNEAQTLADRLRDAEYFKAQFEKFGRIRVTTLGGNSDLFSHTGDDDQRALAILANIVLRKRFQNIAEGFARLDVRHDIVLPAIDTEELDWLQGYLVLVQEEIEPKEAAP